MLADDQRDRLQIVLVSPRNPLNIGAVARAMANFGFAHLSVVAPYAPHWREAKSAVGAPDLLAAAQEYATLAEAVRACTLVLGTGSLQFRKPEQDVVRLPELAPLVHREMEHEGRVALVLGPEKHGLARDDLSWCHVLVEIPTDERQPSMNLGQAAAVCLYELAARAFSVSNSAKPLEENTGRSVSGRLDLLAEVVEETLAVADYSPVRMRKANAHDLRLMLRRLAPSERDTRRMLGIFRRILWRLKR